MASSLTVAAVPVVFSEVNGEENNSVVNTTPGGSESLLIGVVGARFRPSDEVLACHYLTKKVSGCIDGPIFPLIKKVDVYHYEPWRLSSLAHDFGEGVMYFFTHVKMKYAKGKNVNRLAGEGFWKKTGNSSDIKGEDGTTIATKTPLAYYKNRQKRLKTQWLMKEFMLQKQSDDKSKTQLALCVVYHRGTKRKQCEGDDVLVEGSSEIFAENPVMSFAEIRDIPTKRRRSTIGLDETDFDQIPMTFNDQNHVIESQGAADPNVHIPSYQSPLPDFRNYFPTQDSGESLEQFNSGSNPSATFESFRTDNIPYADSEQNFCNMVMESQVAVDPNEYIPSYWSPFPDLGNCLPNSSDSIDQLIKDLGGDDQLFLESQLLTFLPEPLLSPVLNKD